MAQATRDSGWKGRLSALGLKRRRKAAAPPAEGPRDPARPATTAVGRLGEDEAARFLEGRGVRLLARNVRYPDGELDLVAEDGGLLLFVEVKWRRDAARGLAAESVTPRKRDLLVRAARRWLSENASAGRRTVRFDVVAIQGEPARIDWIQGAFDAT